MKDGRVALSKAAGGGYMVTALTDDESNRLGKNKERTQAIFGFDMDTWDDWCTRVRPEDCIMPHRPPAILPNGDPISAPAGAHIKAGQTHLSALAGGTSAMWSLRAPGQGDQYVCCCTSLVSEAVLFGPGNLDASMSATVCLFIASI